MALTLKCGSTTLPQGVTALKRSDELLWSEGTGRGADNGLLVGSVVAKKETYTITWGILTEAQYAVIRGLAGGFWTFNAKLGSATLANFSAYRGAVTGEFVNTISGQNYWRNVTMEVIQR